MLRNDRVITMFFSYGKVEIEYLRTRDRRLGAVIDHVGFIEREVDTDIFASLLKNIAGQQISNAALKTVLARLGALLGEYTPENVCEMGVEALRSCGMSMKKAENIYKAAKLIRGGELDVEHLRECSDAQVIAALTALDGVGEWTAQMMLLFCFCRVDVLSFGDFGIRRGIELLYGEEKLTKARFLEYAKRYSPYASVASFYLWKIGNGEVCISDIDFGDK